VLGVGLVHDSVLDNNTVVVVFVVVVVVVVVVTIVNGVHDDTHLLE
jgi:hypothetical protein